jgi:hypothetical protein
LFLRFSLCSPISQKKVQHLPNEFGFVWFFRRL